MRKTLLAKGVLDISLLMLAGVAAGLVVTDAVNKVQSAAVEMRGAYEPFVHHTFSGGWAQFD
jgi:hypothetical protein